MSKNQNGYVAIGFAVAIVVIGAVGMYALSSEMKQLYQNQIKFKAFYDAEMAIDLLGQQLRQAYDLAAPIAESNGATLMTTNLIQSPATVTYLQVVSGATTATSVTVPVNFYLPNGGKLCTHRSDGLDSISNTLGFGQICIQLPNDFSLQWSHDKDETSVVQISPEFLIKKNAEEKNVSVHEFVYQPLVDKQEKKENHSRSLFSLNYFWGFIEKSFAQTAISGDPGPLSNSPNVSSVTVTGYDPTTQAFQLRYGNNDCDATTHKDRFCITIKICLKLSGTCAATDPIVKQTYVFMKAPQSSLWE